jgi:hypothetical protein
MCPNYKDLNMITIKDIFSIRVINELLDVLHKAIFFTKFGLHS